MVILYTEPGLDRKDYVMSYYELCYILQHIVDIYRNTKVYPFNKYLLYYQVVARTHNIRDRHFTPSNFRFRSSMGGLHFPLSTLQP